MSLLGKLEFKCQSRGMETCLHSRGAALNVRDTIRAEQKFVCFIAQFEGRGSSVEVNWNLCFAYMQSDICSSPADI